MKIRFKLNPENMQEYQENFFKIFSNLEKLELKELEEKRDFFTLKKNGKISYWELNINKLLEEVY
ncbi:MAG: hypothetical protein PHT94_01590 [Candidatus Nanoarchaeia archaeon]|nr:hypothetical protein [Candidatus Nanoarchaeia archaeon]